MDPQSRPHHLAPPGQLSYCAYCQTEYTFASADERQEHYDTCVAPKLGAAMRRIRQEREIS
jgi:hypothetical protein